MKSRFVANTILITSIIVQTFGAMERPQAPGQPLQRMPSTIQAIKSCCGDRGYCASCGIGCLLCCCSCARYIGYTLLVHNKCTCKWESGHNSAKKIIHEVEGAQFFVEALALVGINGYYFRKHLKEKRD